MAIDNFDSALFFDCEATSLDTPTAEIIEFGIVSKTGLCFSERAKPSAYLSCYITKLTGITNSDLASAQSERELIFKAHNILKKAVALGGYFTHLDIEYLRGAYSRNELTTEFSEIEKKPIICAKTLARIAKLDLPEEFSLTDLCQKLGVTVGIAHNAAEDAKMALLATEKLALILGATSLNELIELQGPYVCSPWESPQMTFEQKEQCRQRWQEFVRKSRDST